jgi:hypothetical protein
MSTSRNCYFCSCVHPHKYTHRRDAENAKCLILYIKEFLCVLCVSAVKTVFMDGHNSRTGPAPHWIRVEFFEFPCYRNTPVVRERVCSGRTVEGEFDQFAIAVMQLQQGGVG